MTYIHHKEEEEEEEEEEKKERRRRDKKITKTDSKKWKQSKKTWQRNRQLHWKCVYVCVYLRMSMNVYKYDNTVEERVE